MATLNRSSLMYLSWEIQRAKKYTRARSLHYAWAIHFTESITVHHLVRRHAPARSARTVDPATLSLFRA